MEKVEYHDSAKRISCLIPNKNRYLAVENPCPFVPVSAISALLESCSSAPAPPPLPRSTQSKFVLDQFGIGKAAGGIGTGPSPLQRLYNGRCEQLVAQDGLKSAAGRPYSR